MAIRLPATSSCGASGESCTADGRPLSHSLSVTVAGPAGLSVSDAKAEENVDPRIDFTVTPDRAESGTVTVGRGRSGWRRARSTSPRHPAPDSTRALFALREGVQTQVVPLALLGDPDHVEFPLRKVRLDLVSHRLAQHLGG